MYESIEDVIFHLSIGTRSPDCCCDHHLHTEMPDCNGFATVTTMPKSKHSEDPKELQLTGVKKVCLSPPSAARNKHKKSVSFKDHSLEEVIEFEDDVESKNARKLFWEFMAVDRFRFKDRIQRVEPLLSSVLSATHRRGIYAHRMLTQSSLQMSTPHPAVCATVTVEKMEVEVETVGNKFNLSISMSSNAQEMESSSAA